MPPPTPVPRMTPNTTGQPRPAPSAASETAKQLASFDNRTSSRSSDALEVAIERMAVQLRGVGVLDQAGGGRDRAGMADADAAARADLGFELAHHGGHALDGRLVAAGRRRPRARGRVPCRCRRGRCLRFSCPPRSMPIRMPSLHRNRARMSMLLSTPTRVERRGQPRGCRLAAQLEEILQEGRLDVELADRAQRRQRCRDRRSNG